MHHCLCAHVWRQPIRLRSSSSSSSSRLKAQGSRLEARGSRLKAQGSRLKGACTAPTRRIHPLAHRNKGLQGQVPRAAASRRARRPSPPKAVDVADVRLRAHRQPRQVTSGHVADGRKRSAHESRGAMRGSRGRGGHETWSCSTSSAQPAVLPSTGCLTPPLSSSAAVASAAA